MTLGSVDTDNDGNLPLAIALLGAGAVCAFLSLRPWPQASGKPIKPGAYVVDVLKGTPPPAGPQTFSDTEVHLTEVGLGALLAVWSAGKIGQAAAGVAQGVGAAGGVLSRLIPWIKKLGADAEEGAGAAGEGA